MNSNNLKFLLWFLNLNYSFCPGIDFGELGEVGRYAMCDTVSCPTENISGGALGTGLKTSDPIEAGVDTGVCKWGAFSPVFIDSCWCNYNLKDHFRVSIK